MKQLTTPGSVKILFQWASFKSTQQVHREPPGDLATQTRRRPQQPPARHRPRCLPFAASWLLALHPSLASVDRSSQEHSMAMAPGRELLQGSLAPQHSMLNAWLFLQRLAQTDLDSRAMNLHDPCIAIPGFFWNSPNLNEKHWICSRKLEKILETVKDDDANKNKLFGQAAPRLFSCACQVAPHAGHHQAPIQRRPPKVQHQQCPKAVVDWFHWCFSISDTILVVDE